MRVSLGPPPLDPAFDPQPPWRPLREPRRIVFVILLAVPLGLAAAVGFAILAFFLAPSGAFVLALDDPVVWLALLLLVPLHEGCHALALPSSLASPALVVGFWPRTLLAYVHYQGELTRTRFLVVALCPLMLLSVLCLAAIRFVPPLETFAFALGLFNAVGAGGDLLATALVLAQVPRNGRLRNQGWYTYWRPAS